MHIHHEIRDVICDVNRNGNREGICNGNRDVICDGNPDVICDGNRDGNRN